MYQYAARRGVRMVTARPQRRRSTARAELDDIERTPSGILWGQAVGGSNPPSPTGPACAKKALDRANISRV